MRYLLLRPQGPTDPRHLKLESMPKLHSIFPVIADCDTQEDAARTARALYPDAVAMPVPFEVGSGEVFMLGLVSNVGFAPPSVRAPFVSIPFVLLVQAVAEHNSDKADITKRRQFAEKAWRSPVAMPMSGIVARQVEVRAGDLENPVRVNAMVGRASDGRLVVRCEVGGVAMSLTFLDSEIELG